jgi:hypothetical protein
LKTVREEVFKFYVTYLDALMDQNYSLELVEIEDNVYQPQIQSQILKGNFRLKSFLRDDSFIEKVYIKID